MDEHQIEDIAERAAEKAVEAFALRLGIDPDDPKALAEWRENLAFIARVKRGANQVSAAIIKTCAATAVGALLWMLAQGFRDWMILPKVN